MKNILICAMVVPYLDWMYIADKLIYLFGYMFLIYLCYTLTTYYVEFTRINKTKPATQIEKFSNYFSFILILAILAGAFTIKANHHKPEKYVIAFIALIIPTILGLAKGYGLDKRLTHQERLQRKDLHGKKIDNREQI